MHAATLALLRQRLAVLTPSVLEIEDQSERHIGHAGARGGAHLRLFVVSTAFAGKNTRDRQRLVYDAAGDLLPGRIHALIIAARTPEET
ncbi:BolA family protein [Azonexus sp.]|uniref:BolA family protein n=1 Tax=Azonexus sp. TaxID=1872668 RepID=UPI0039E25F54